jgi:hypothetical protein
MLAGHSLFATRGNKRDVFEDIMTKTITLPDSMFPEAQSMLAGLLTRKVEDRLGTEGADEVTRKHYHTNIVYSLLGSITQL